MSKFRENKNLSYNLFIQMAFNDRDRNVRVKAWIPRSKGNEGRDDLEPDNIQSSAS